MSNQLQKISDTFWNIRGDFKIGGILNIGTQASLVRCGSGKFVLLDACPIQGEMKEQIDAISNNGNDIQAVINLHPFHTIHVRDVHNQYPDAKLYGTRRHIKKFPDLHWQPEFTESEGCAELFENDFDFSVPVGVDFISSNENLHFSSVLAYHKASKTIHSDDTLMYLKLPGLLGQIVKPEIRFHMTLSKTLETRAGAAEDFRAWATRLAEQWGDAENLCAAHSACLLGSENQYASIANRILAALQKVEKTLHLHEQKFGQAPGS
jgi:hypothetical protein